MTNTQFRSVFRAATLNDIEVEDNGDDSEAFVYCNGANDIRVLAKSLI